MTEKNRNQELLEEAFNKLDQDMMELARSDSSVEYAYHIRSKLDEVIATINIIRLMNGLELIKPNKYFMGEED